MPWSQPEPEHEPTLIQRIGLFAYRLGWLGITGLIIFALTIGWTMIDP